MENDRMRGLQTTLKVCVVLSQGHFTFKDFGDYPLIGANRVAAEEPNPTVCSGHMAAQYPALIFILANDIC